MGFWNEVLLNLYAYGLVAAGAGMAAASLYFPARFKRLWPLQRGQRGAWSGREVLFAFFLFYLTLMFGDGLLGQSGFLTWFYGRQLSTEPIDLARRALWATPLASALFAPLCLWMLRVTTGDRLADVGLSRIRWRENLLLGFVASIVVTPLVLGVFFAISFIFQQFEWTRSTHAFEQLAAQSLMPAEWLVLFVSALLMAPITEELFFRGILQSWLVRAAPLSHAVIAAITVTRLVVPYLDWFAARDQSPFPGWGVPIFFGLLLAGYAIAFRQTWKKFLRTVDQIEAGPETQAAGLSEEAAAAIDEDLRIALHRHALAWRRVSAPLAMYGTAVLFAACHGAWPAPMPLFLLGLVLSFLAYRTQSLLAPLVLHALFNTVATLVLVLSQVG